MTFLILWGGLWLALYVLAAVATATTPTTARPTAPSIFWTGLVSLVFAVFGHGVFSLIAGLFA